MFRGPAGNVIMQGLQEYADVAAVDMKAAVSKTAADVKKEIKANAPRDTESMQQAGLRRRIWRMHIWCLIPFIRRTGASWHIFWKRDMQNEMGQGQWKGRDGTCRGKRCGGTGGSDRS